MTTSKFALIAAAIIGAGAPASAATITFQFSQDPAGAGAILGRSILPGTVLGSLDGLIDNSNSAPTTFTISQVDPALGILTGTYTSALTIGTVTLTNNVVTGANLLMNFNSAGSPFQLRLNFEGHNLLHWNGGPTIKAGQGNALGFAGAIYGGPANTVPEPAAWAMLIAGFGLVGAAMRRRALALA